MDALLKQQMCVADLVRKFQTNTRKSVGKANLTKGFVQGRIVLLDKYWQRFEDHHEDILAADTDPAFTSYFENSVHEEIESIYSESMGYLYNALDKFAVISTHSTSQQAQHPAGATDNRRNNNDIKLPRITIPTFSGDFKAWTSFHDLFLTLVVNNASLSDVERLHHLKSSLTGDAACLLRQFAIQGNNFTPAWDLLKKRFANKKLILHAELDRFMSIPKATSFNIEMVRKVLDISTECITAVNNLIPAEQRYDALLMYMISQKLDNKTLEAWELSVKGSDDLADLDALSTFLEEYCRSMLLVHAPKKAEKADHQSTNRNEKLPYRNRISNSFHSTGNSSTPQISCSFCQKQHFLYQCFRFKKLPLSERKQFVDSKPICSKCLSSSHNVAQCNSSYQCIKCDQPHHLLLHVPTESKSSIVIPAKDRAEASTSTSLPIHHTHVAQRNERPTLLATALISVQSMDGTPMVLRALLDQGSEVTFITREAASLLRLKFHNSSAVIRGIGSAVAGKCSHLVKLSVASIYNTNVRFFVDAIVMTKLTDMLPSKMINAHWPHIENLALADPKYFESSKIDIVLGADIYDELILDGVKKGAEGMPIAQLTALGWVLSGKMYVPSSQNNANETWSRNVLSCHASNEATVCEQLRKFWELEEVAVSHKLSKEDEQCETHYKLTHRRCHNGKYEVSLPFKTKELPIFGDSRQQAMSRLFQIERRLKANPDLSSQYKAFMDEYLSLGHMRSVSSNSTHSPAVFYLPHHAIIKTSSSSTKLRVVFDASAQSSNGVSLNQTLHVGPSIQQDIFSILLRWRKHRIVITGDVEKMYRQIGISEPHQAYQRIIWRNERNEIQDYELTTITYGTASAPFLAIRTLQQLAHDEKESFPIAAQKTLEDMYVDDFISGSDTVEDALALHNEMSQMFLSGGLYLRKWASNSSEVLNSIPIAHQESSTSLDICKTEIMKTLGMYWNTNKDYFQFKISLTPEPTTLSKRSLLSDVAKLYDPLGFLAPVVIAAKMLFQSLWLLGLSWDEVLPSDISKEWITLRSSLPALTDLVIPRWIGSLSTTNDIQLHGFCDASNKAYAAVVYARISDNGVYRIEILASKTRVAPIKRVSLPNLELCGATLLSHLLIKVASAMSFKTSTIFAWTDSTIVLDWLRSNTHKQTFVANRVSTILTLLTPDQWNHVRSKDNPADVASRGLCPTLLKDHSLWWHGPNWLQSLQNLWPKYQSSKKEDTTDALVFMASKDADFTLVFTKFSNINKVIRVVAFCIRFGQNCRTKDKSQRCVDPLLSANEITISRNRLIKCMQKENFADDIKSINQNKSSKWQSLCPFICAEGFLRVGGRLQNASIGYDQKHPILLPRDHHITTLIVRNTHLKTLHGGNNLTLATLRMEYWIPSARNLIRRIIHQCVKCHRFTAKCTNQLMSALPTSRVSPSKTFAHTGVDYAGPVDIRLSKHKGRGTFKGYIVVFVCMSTKAVHLELASDLSSSTFLAAFKRFISRRGLCSDIYSDNGTNFVGANRELRTQFDQQIQQITQVISEELAMEKIQWHFIPPGTPHFGGLWEASVKSMKFHLKRILGQSVLTFEEFYTLLTQIEANLNSRPLSPLSSDPNDFMALTPGHFIIGGPLNAVPVPSYLNIPDNRLQRWQLIEKLNQDFWKVWSQQYLNELQQRPTKWTTRRDNLEIGDLVVITDERFPPSSWRLARVVETHPGSDGIVRVATVRHKSGTLKRPTSKLCVLPIDRQISTQPTKSN